MTMIGDDSIGKITAGIHYSETDFDSGGVDDDVFR